VTLADALGLAANDVVAIVGGGGKSTAMFRLAREMLERGGRAITTTTTRIFGAQIALSPVHVPAAEATRERVLGALDAHRQGAKATLAPFGHRLARPWSPVS